MFHYCLLWANLLKHQAKHWWRCDSYVMHWGLICAFSWTGLNMSSCMQKYEFPVPWCMRPRGECQSCAFRPSNHFQIIRKWISHRQTEPFNSIKVDVEPKPHILAPNHPRLNSFVLHPFIQEPSLIGWWLPVATHNWHKHKNCIMGLSLRFCGFPVVCPSEARAVADAA